jgi:hypothetical protein
MAQVTVNQFGLLDPGINSMTLEEIGELFGRFQQSDRRMRLMGRLQTFAHDVWQADARIQILVDGSFVMTKVDEPDDIDVVLILPVDWDYSAQLRPFEYNVVSKRMVRRLYGFDMLIGIAGEKSSAEAIEFFAQVKARWLRMFGIPAETAKGLVKIKP